MKLIFLGSLVDPRELQQFPNVSVAGNKMQYNLLNYISRKGISLKVFSFEVHAKYPIESKIWVSSSKKIMPDGFEVCFLPYLNFSVIKEISLMFFFWLSLLKSISSDTIVLSYNLFIYQALALNFFRLFFKVKTVCLLADLSAGGKKKGFFGRFTRWAFDKYHYHSLKECPYFIALNEYALNLYTKPLKYMVMDGGVEPSEYPLDCETWNGRKKTIVYSGALVDYSGVMNLVEAMKFVDSANIELNIYGSGVLADDIVEKTKIMGNVKYFGSVGNKEILKIQHKSWLLVNPRPVENDTAKVTFPSKIFEYMMSGRPVLSTRLNGFSQNYDNLLFWIDDASPRGIADAINELDLKEDDFLLERAVLARNFMLKNKTWCKNVDDIVNFLYHL